MRHLAVRHVAQMKFDGIALSHADVPAGHGAAEGLKGVAHTFGNLHFLSDHVDFNDDLGRIVAAHRRRVFGGVARTTFIGAPCGGPKSPSSNHRCLPSARFACRCRRYGRSPPVSWSRLRRRWTSPPSYLRRSLATLIRCSSLSSWWRSAVGKSLEPHIQGCVEVNQALASGTTISRPGSPTDDGRGRSNRSRRTSPTPRGRTTTAREASCSVSA